MTFIESLFPECIAPYMEGGPRYLLRNAFTIGGQRYGNLDDPEPIYEFSLAQPVMPGDDFEALRAFWMATQGGANNFRLKDPSDFELTQSNSVGSLISGSTYQMNRRYVSDAGTTLRPLYKLASGLLIYRLRSGSYTDITGSTTLNLNNGQFTVTGHSSGDTYHGVGEFHIPACFLDPAAVWRVIGGDRMLTEWTNIRIREVREIA